MESALRPLSLGESPFPLRWLIAFLRIVWRRTAWAQAPYRISDRRPDDPARLPDASNRYRAGETPKMSERLRGASPALPASHSGLCSRLCSLLLRCPPEPEFAPKWPYRRFSGSPAPL